MSDAAEKTELPTGKKLDEASKRGQVAYSKELTAALMFLILLMGLRFWGGDLVDNISELVRTAFSLKTHTQVSVGEIVGLLTGLTRSVTAMLLPIFLRCLYGQFSLGEISRNVGGFGRRVWIGVIFDKKAARTGECFGGYGFVDDLHKQCGRLRGGTGKGCG